MFTERLLIPACTMFTERLAGDRQIAAHYTRLAHTILIMSNDLE
jgi:hypothetical protein